MRIHRSVAAWLPVWLLLVMAPGGSAGVDPLLSVVPASSPETDQRLSQLIEPIVRESVPRTFEKEQQWEKRKRIPSGLDIESRGRRLRVSKRERDVRHGFWRRMVVTVVDPEERLHLRIEDFRAPAPGEFRADVFVNMRANVDVRFEHWHYGVKLFNSHTNADATLDVYADCSLKVRMEVDGTTRGPVVVLQPTVHRVKLALPNLDVNKLGGVSGSVVRDVGDSLQEVVEQILQAQEESIRARAQRALDERAEDLRFPLADVLSSPWWRVWRGL